jgi:hypothetical protein
MTSPKQRPDSRQPGRGRKDDPNLGQKEAEREKSELEEENEDEDKDEDELEPMERPERQQQR